MYYNGKLEKIIYVNVNASPEPESRESFICPRLAGVTYPNPRYRVVYRGEWYKPNESFYVFEYVRSGNGWLLCGDKRVNVGAGDFYFYHKDVDIEYGADSEHPYEKLWLNISGSLVDGLCATYQFPTDIFVRHVNVESPFLRMHALLSRTTSDTAARDMQELALLLHEVIVTVMRERFAGQTSEDEISIPMRLRSFLNNNLYSPFTLEDLAHMAYLSKTHIIRIFRAAYGTTPMNYLQTKRIETAKTLLSGSQMTVGEIASILQFGDSQHFSHRFKAQTGCSPTDYRRRVTVIPADKK